MYSLLVVGRTKGDESRRATGQVRKAHHRLPTIVESWSSSNSTRYSYSHRFLSRRRQRIHLRGPFDISVPQRSAQRPGIRWQHHHPRPAQIVYILTTKLLKFMQTFVLLLSRFIQNTLTADNLKHIKNLYYGCEQRNL